jgi:hypothetical protein
LDGEKTQKRQKGGGHLFAVPLFWCLTIGLCSGLWSFLGVENTKSSIISGQLAWHRS